MGTAFAAIDLDPAAERLFCEMVETALEANSQSERMFMLAVHGTVLDELDVLLTSPRSEA